MENNYQNLYTPVNSDTNPLPAPQKPKIHYTSTEQITAFLCMIAGFLFIRFSIYHVSGLFTTIFCWLLTTLEIVFLKKSGRTFTKGDKAMLFILYFFACAFTMTANTCLKTLTMLFLILVSHLFLLGNSNSLHTVFRFLPHALSVSIFAMPFIDFDKCFHAVNSFKIKSTWKNAGKNAGYIFVGLLLAIPVTCIVAALLCMADENMSAMLSHFPKISISSEYLTTLIPHILFGILIGCLLFSSLYSSIHKSIVLDAQNCKEKTEAVRRIPNLMLYTAVTPICILYILYVISQISYFMGGFTGNISNGYTYAEYARKGFFELCVICCINLTVIFCMDFFAKMTGSAKPLLLKIYNIYLCICSLFLAGTAIAKMFLYIKFYGMTQMRIYTTWFMFLLVIGFIAIIIRQFIYPFPIGRTAFIVFTIMFAFLVFSRPDAWITRYNANQYLAGNLEDFDSSVLSGMSADAWAALSGYDTAQQTMLAEHLTEKLQMQKINMQADFYETLNLSAWEILCRVS